MNTVSKIQLSTAKLLINGEFVESKTQQWQDIVNPATQEVIGLVPFATPEEIQAAIASAKSAFVSWRETPIQARMRIMLKLQQLIRDNAKKIAQVLTAEQGKTLADAEGDIQRGLEVVEHACSIGTLQMGEYIEGVARGVDTYTLQQPLGVCAGITPFNFPAMIPLWMFPMAIVCGNTFVLKPSEQDPLSTMMLVELAIEAGIPAGVLNVVHGGKDVVDALCTHQDIKAISFVGSTAVGTHVTLLGKTPSPKILMKAFEEVKPNLIITVPLVIEKIYKNVIQPLINKRSMKWALNIPLLDNQIYAQIRKKLIDALGGRFKEVIIGGAAMNPEVTDFFHKIKFPFTIGYGMTECAPLISYAPWNEFIPGSAGKILDIMKVRIDSDDPYNITGEIQVCGENVMKGYYKNEEATREVFTEDGWLKTGDLGTIDANGFIYIRGRSKTMILSSNGQNIFPEEIESKLNNMPFVLESLIIERNKKLVALVYPDYESLDSLGLNTPENLKTVMDENLKNLNKLVGNYEQVSKIQLYPTEFEKTPKKSIKRFLYNSITEE